MSKDTPYELTEEQRTQLQGIMDKLLVTLGNLEEAKDKLMEDLTTTLKEETINLELAKKEAKEQLNNE